MKAKFWTFEKIEDPLERESYQKSLEELKLKYKIYSKFLLLDVLLYLYEESILKQQLTVHTYPIKLYFPKSMPRAVLVIIDTMMAEVSMLSIIVVDVLCFTTAALAEMQFKMLNYKMMKIFSSMRGSEHRMDIRKNIRECNDHLTFLFNFRNMLNETFAPLLLLYFGVIIFTLCTGLYCVSNEESVEGLIRGCAGEIGWFFQFMFSYCIPVQKLVDEVAKTAYSLYQSRWYDYPRHYKDVLFLLGKSQQEFYYSAGGVTNIDHQSGLAALKTTVSYWGFLRAVGDKFDE